MTRRTSIFDPKSTDLQEFGVRGINNSEENPLWIGRPNIIRAFSLSTPTTLFMLVILIVYLIVNYILKYKSIIYVNNTLIVLISILFFIIVFDIIFILFCLYKVVYIVTDKHIYICSKDIYTFNYLRFWGVVDPKLGGRVLKYEIKNINYINMYKSVFNGGIGNIYLPYELLMEAKGKIINRDNTKLLKYKKIKFNFSTVIYVQNTMYSIVNAEEVCNIICNVANSEGDLSNSISSSQT